MLLGAAPFCMALPGLVPVLGGSAHAGIALEERKLPMKFSWVACQPSCRGWVSAVGIVTADSPRDFDEFARGRQKIAERLKVKGTTRRTFASRIVLPTQYVCPCRFG
jgi:hypothetical protein